MPQASVTRVTGTVAITVGALLVAIAQRDPAYAIERVDWDHISQFENSTPGPACRSG
ncbi:MAG: hypothetical protein ACREL9_05190 [Gemmatimonadales bacterium]